MRKWAYALPLGISLLTALAVPGAAETRWTFRHVFQLGESHRQIKLVHKGPWDQAYRTVLGGELGMTAAQAALWDYETSIAAARPAVSLATSPRPSQAAPVRGGWKSAAGVAPVAALCAGGLAAGVAFNGGSGHVVSEDVGSKPIDAVPDAGTGWLMLSGIPMVLKLIRRRVR